MMASLPVRQHSFAGIVFLLVVLPGLMVRSLPLHAHAPEIPEVEGQACHSFFYIPALLRIGAELSSPLNAENVREKIIEAGTVEQWNAIYQDKKKNGGTLHALSFPAADEVLKTASDIAAYVLVRDDCAQQAYHLPHQGNTILNPGAGAFEHCMPMAAGDEVVYQFSASAPVDFNIHYHIGEETRYPVKKESVKSIKSSYKAADNQFYCLMWQNSEDQPIDIEIGYQQF